ncbi:homocysteine S-methyltransferase [Hwanghaeella grinnelliae]|uniref:Homocysteine S-methyltransferase n=1 Tax=Hwanghaeella grinnelliae TaxID=2500179 RepID=A0A3S2W8I2_9PROT|nr:homocysteine S-methyltransferase [Hwanghaeella grinnelliae]
MAKYRNGLPQLRGQAMLTDGGLETTLVFIQGIDLPYFAAFDLLRTAEGTKTIRDYYSPYARIAIESGKGFVLASPTWRASADWGDRLGYSAKALDQVNRDAISLLAEIRATFETPENPFVLSGDMGPRGDGYDPSHRMSVDEAQDYHATQIGTFADTEADLVSILTLNYVEEAIGIVRAAQAAGIPSAISFTVETDGRLPTGQSLGDAIEQVDAETGNGPAYFMINCAHPTHFSGAILEDAPWKKRVWGLRANASRLSHAELDNSEELDAGNPAELGRQYKELQSHLPNLKVFGGCCGTDHRHVGEIARHISV